MNNGRVITLLMLPLVLSACSYIKLKDTSDNYKHAKVAPPISYPENLTRLEAEALYEIPGDFSGSAATTSFEDSPKLSSVIEPPKVASGNEKIVSLRSLSDDYWILAQFRTSSMWTALQGFANTQTFKVERLDPITGILETKWQERKGQKGLSKLLFKVNSGVQSGTSELNVIAVKRETSNTGAVNWQQGSNDKALELETLKRAAKYLDGRNIRPAAQAGVEHDGLKVASNGDDKYLKLDLNLKRAWGSTLQAVERAGYRVENKSLENGKIKISKGLSTEESKKGFFSGWAGSDKAVSDVTLQLQQIDNFTMAIFVTAEEKLTEKKVVSVLHELMPYFN